MISFEQQDGGVLPVYKLAIVEEGREIGFYLLVPQAIDIYEIHTHMEPEVKGSSVEISKQALKETFILLPNMQNLVTKVPINNPLAKRLSLKVGMRPYGVLPESFEGADQELFYINRKDVQCQ